MPANAEDSQAIDLSSAGRFRVGAANIDPPSHEATFGGSAERLQPQNLKVLVALADRRGRLVTRDELIRRCWDGRVIGEDVINRAISTLRQFAERAGGFFIETVPRSGYRLVETSPPRKRQWVITVVSLIIVALAAVEFFELPRRGNVRLIPTISVLPFATASADPQERELASDARDAVVHALSQTEFRVRLANSATDEGRSASDFALSANVGKNSGKFVVTVQVQDTVHGAIVYSQVFEAAQVSAGDLPERIGAQIAGSLGWTSSLLRSERSHSSDPAITAVLFGQNNSYQTVRQIAAKAPNSAIAQIALAFAAGSVLEDLPRDQRTETAAVARQAMERVRVLEPRYGGTEILWCALHSRVRMFECENHLRSGMRNDPDSPWVESSLASLLKDVGRTNEALRLASNALGHDPYAEWKIGITLRMLEVTGRGDEADALYGDSLRWWPEDLTIFSNRVYGIMGRGDFGALARAIQQVQKTNFASRVNPGLPVLAAIHAKDLPQVRKLCPVDQPGSFKRDLCMLALAHLGDNDQAFALVAQTYPNRIGRTPVEEDKLWLDNPRWGETDILMGPAAEPLRRDPRYLDFARRVGLLAYWRTGRLPDFCQTLTPEPICSRLRVDH